MAMLVFGATTVLLTGCSASSATSGSPGEPDARDSGPPRSVDSGAGAAPDSSAGQADSSAPDTATSPADAAPDASLPIDDAAMMDSAVVDSAVADSAAADTAIVDSAIADTATTMAADTSPPAVTWAYLYPKYFAGTSTADTQGHCSSSCHFHGQGNSPSDSQLVQAAYNAGGGGTGLSLFGGGMPLDNESWMDSTAAADLTAWANASFP